MMNSVTMRSDINWVVVRLCVAGRSTAPQDWPTVFLNPREKELTLPCSSKHWAFLSWLSVSDSNLNGLPISIWHIEYQYIHCSYIFLHTPNSQKTITDHYIGNVMKANTDNIELSV